MDIISYNLTDISDEKHPGNEIIVIPVIAMIKALIINRRMYNQLNNLLIRVVGWVFSYSLQ